MAESRINNALERLTTALARIEASQQLYANLDAANRSSHDTSSERVSALVNRHEKLREEIADTVRDLELLLEEHSS